MTQSPPYELAAARRMVLYRIPSLAADGRIIELHFAGTAPVLGAGWRGACFETRQLGAVTDPVGDQSPQCDMVVLHHTLDDAAARGGGGAAAQVFAGAIDLLHSGGVVAGCFKNRHAFGKRPRQRGNFSAASFRQMAAAAGIAELTLHCLHPDPDAPTLLLDQAAFAYRHFGRKDASGHRHAGSTVRYLLKQAWVASALGRRVAPGYFFVGRKP